MGTIAMIKLTYCIRRRAELSPAAFHQHWREQHAPLVQKHAAAIGAKRYVQSHTVEAEGNALLRSSRGADEPFDGVAEVWWESMKAFNAALQTTAGREAAQALLDDERNFIDFARSSLFLTEEHCILSD